MDDDGRGRGEEGTAGRQYKAPSIMGVVVEVVVVEVVVVVKVVVVQVTGLR